MLCLRCNSRKPVVDLLCVECYKHLSNSIAKPSEIAAAHRTLHYFYERADRGEIPMTPDEVNNLKSALTTICWVVGCSYGHIFRTNLKTLLHWAVTQVEETAPEVEAN